MSDKHFMLETWHLFKAQHLIEKMLLSNAFIMSFQVIFFFWFEKFD